MQPMRPRFHLTVPFSPEEVIERFEQRLACDGCPCHLITLGQHLDVQIHERLRHFWSPHLSVEVSPSAGGGAELNGLFGPNANVWTLFLASYAFLLLSASFAGMFGVSQLLAGGDTPWGLSLAGCCLAALVLPYVGSLVGQRLAAEQMQMLRCFLRAALDLPSEQALPAACVAEGLGSQAQGTPLPTVQPGEA